jgi:hypothetical protein
VYWHTHTYNYKTTAINNTHMYSEFFLACKASGGRVGRSSGRLTSYNAQLRFTSALSIKLTADTKLPARPRHSLSGWSLASHRGGIFGGQSGRGAVFSSVSPANLHSTE